MKRDLPGGALAALDCAVDGTDVADGCCFAGEKQTVVDWLGKNRLGIEAADGDVAVGAAREWIGLPIREMVRAKLAAQRRAFHA